jgi:aryl-alcohol dehydrogenase-like predicted oxidoreductase
VQKRKDGNMEYITYGRTGLRVSNIALGTWELGGSWGAFDRNQAVSAIRQARADGITFFDTAQAYGFGASEQLLGEALRDDLDHRRDEVVIATKGGVRLVDGRFVRDSSPDWLRSGVEESLEHLGVDVIDLYQVHWPDPKVPLEETAGAMAELIEDGKVRHVGVSNYDVVQMRAFSGTCPVESLQPPYHLFRRDVEDQILPYTRAENIGVMAYGSLAHGLLTGTLHESTVFAADDWRSGHPDFEGESYRRSLSAAERLKNVASDLGCSLGQLAVAWVLANPAVHAAIVGSRRATHVTEAALASSLRLPAEILGLIERVLAIGHQIGGPSPEGARPAKTRSSSRSTPADPHPTQGPLASRHQH